MNIENTIFYKFYKFYDNHEIPPYLWCFDNEKCALIGNDIVKYVKVLSSFDQLKYTPSNLPQEVINNIKTIIETFRNKTEL